MGGATLDRKGIRPKAKHNNAHECEQFISCTAVRDVGVVRSSIEAGCLDQDGVIQDYEMTTLPDVHATLSSSSSSSMNE